MRTFYSVFYFLLLSLSVQAQDLIVVKQGNPITAYNIEISGNSIFYTKDPKADSQILRVSKDSVLMVRHADGSVLDLTFDSVPNQQESKSNESFPEIDEKDIHGSLIAQGNCVYIPTDSPYDYEKAGQEKLKVDMEKWAYWKVVSKLEQAHFVLQFTTQTKGRDCSHLIIRPRKYYKAHPILIYSTEVQGLMARQTWNVKGSVGVVVNYTSSSENSNDNIRSAELLADNLRKIVTEPNVGDGKRFFKTNSKALDADNNNDTSDKSPWGLSVK